MAMKSLQGRLWGRKIQYWQYGWHTRISIRYRPLHQAHMYSGRIFSIRGNYGAGTIKMLPLNRLISERIEDHYGVGSIPIMLEKYGDVPGRQNRDV